MNNSNGLWLAFAAMLPMTACIFEPGGLVPREAEPAPAARGGRLMPPATLACERNDLTSYTGIVTEYRRTESMTRVVIRTDADTTETVEVQHDAAASAYLINGKPFTTDDWRRIESAAGVLKPGTRITAWVCLDGVTEAVLDWRPI